MESAEKICVKWNDFGQNVRSLFDQFRNDGEFADVALACEDGQEVLAHQILLASQSPFFMNVLKRNRHPHPIIYMRGVKSENLVALVHFLYRGEMNIHREDLAVCLSLAEELQLAGFSSGEFSKSFLGDFSEDAGCQVPSGTMCEENVSRESVRESLSRESVIKIGESLMKKSIFDPFLPVPDEDCFTQSPPGSSENLVLEETELRDLPKVVPTNFKVEANDLDEAIDFTSYEYQMVQLDKKIKTMIGFSKNLIPTTAGKREKKERKRICKVCGKEDRYNGIKRHIEAKHFSGLLHPCDICGKTFGTRYKLAKHMLGQHRKSSC